MNEQVNEKKIGRPRKDVGQLKCVVLRIRMTENDKSMIENAAAHERLDSSEWARNVLLKSAKKSLS